MRRAGALSERGELRRRFRFTVVATVSFQLALDALEDLFTVYGNCLWGIDANTHLIAFHAQHRHGYIVTDHYRLTHAPGQNQHFLSFA